MTAVILKILHPFKYPEVRLISSEQIHSYSLLAEIEAAEMAEVASLVAGPPKCFINGLERFI